MALTKFFHRISSVGLAVLLACTEPEEAPSPAKVPVMTSETIEEKVAESPTSPKEEETPFSFRIWYRQGNKVIYANDGAIVRLKRQPFAIEVKFEGKYDSPDDEYALFIRATPIAPRTYQTIFCPWHAGGSEKEYKDKQLTVYADFPAEISPEVIYCSDFEVWNVNFKTKEQQFSSCTLSKNELVCRREIEQINYFVEDPEGVSVSIVPLTKATPFEMWYGPRSGTPDRISTIDKEENTQMPEWDPVLMHYLIFQ